jgi:succinylglutamic semialdehyde dehydrogenase
MTGLNLIAGKWVEGEGKAFQAKNPATGQVTWSGKGASAEQVRAAFAAARAAFDGWRHVPLADRYAVLEKFSALAAKERTALAKIVSEETGKIRWDAEGEVAGVLKKAEISLKSFRARTPETVGKGTPRASLRHKPHGVMAVIGPFNFPLHLPNGHIAPALLAGNAVVFKPSSFTPRAGEALVRLYEQAGLPKGLIALIQGGAEAGRAMLDDPDLKGLLFTGGVPTGKAMARTLVERLDVVLALELGGNNPLVAWEAEDAEAAARIALMSAYISSGQRCTCARRLIVRDGRDGQKIVTALAGAMAGISVGKPDDEPQPFMGPLVSSEAAGQVLERQALLEKLGAKVLVRAERLTFGGAFVSPALIDVTEAEGRPDAECFGPLLQVVRVKSFEAAIAEANHTAYGLAAGILTDDEKLRDRFFAEIEAGVVNWNQMLPGASSEAPFSGIKMSGNHRPSAFYAADYAAWPMASLENPGKLAMPPLPKGLKG